MQVQGKLGTEHGIRWVRHNQHVAVRIQGVENRVLERRHPFRLDQLGRYWHFPFQGGERLNDRFLQVSCFPFS